MYKILFLIGILICIKTIELDLVKIGKKNDLIEPLQVGNLVFVIELELGTPPQKIFAQIDTGSFLSLVDNGSYHKLKSTSYKKIGGSHEIHYVGSSSSGIESTESFTFPLGTCNLDFLLVDDDPCPGCTNGLLGLGRDYSSQLSYSYSLIHQLKKSNIIKKKIFSQKYINSTNGKLIIGDFPEEVINLQSNYTTMRVNFDDSSISQYWTGYLSYLLIGEVYDFKLATKFGNWVIFDTGSNICDFPSSSMDLFQGIFNSAIESGNCFKNTNNENHLFYCNTEYLKANKLPYLNLIFNGWAYRFETNKIMINGFQPGYSVFPIQFSTALKGKYIIGEPLLSQYLFVFDSEDNQVGLFGDFRYDFTMYTQDPPIDYFLYYFKYFIIGFIILGIIIVVAIIFLIYYLRRKKQRKLDLEIKLNPNNQRIIN